MRITNKKKELTGHYEMCDLGEARWFLAMEISRDRVERTIMIDQRKYIRKILTHFGLHNSKLVSTPMATNLKLPALETSTVDQQLYQSMLGSLMYVAVGTRPNIMFAIHHLSQHSIAPGFVTNHAQPPRTDVPHFCAWAFPTRTDLFETVIECTATDHVIFSQCIYISLHGNLLPLA